MVVRDFDFVGITVLPAKADPVLIVDPDAVLPDPVSSQALEAIPGWDAQLPQILHSIHLCQLAPCDRPQVDRTRSSGAPGRLAVEHVLGGSIRE
jgi:hypothetical protein